MDEEHMGCVRTDYKYGWRRKDKGLDGYPSAGRGRRREDKIPLPDDNAHKRMESDL